MATTNRYGLQRSIPDPIKRQIRQRCGFGCVMCGCAIYQYEHVDPPYSNAREHDPMAIVLLCGGCHDRVTRKLLSKNTIKAKSLNPKCKEDGFSFGALDIGTSHPEIVLGTFTGVKVEILLRIYNDEILSILPPEEKNGPYRINAFLCDTDGKIILSIKENEWKTPSHNWDVEIVGPRITIRKKQGEISLILRTEPPTKLIIERLVMFHKGAHIECRENENISIKKPGLAMLTSTKGFASGSKIGIDIRENSIAMGCGGGSVGFESLTLGEIVTPKHRATHNPWQSKFPRNGKCPFCNSGKRYKQCCGRIAVITGNAKNN